MINSDLKLGGWIVTAITIAGDLCHGRKYLEKSNLTHIVEWE